MIDLNKITRKEFLAVPMREKGSESTIYDFLVVLPNHKHESGYRSMVVIGGKVGGDNVEFEKITEWSDHLLWDTADETGFSNDMLFVSKALCFYGVTPNTGFVCGTALSTMKIRTVGR